MAARVRGLDSDLSMPDMRLRTLSSQMRPSASRLRMALPEGAEFGTHPAVHSACRAAADTGIWR